MKDFIIGTGKSNITDRRARLQLQGMMDPEQKSTGVLHELFARAYYIASGSEIVVMVIADLWACTQLLKAEVLSLLKQKHQEDIRWENLLLAGTHTHNAPGGYSGYQLFDQPSGRTDKTTLNILADGITQAIIMAKSSRQAGKLYMTQGEIMHCGVQRSKAAYLNNPAQERAAYKSDTDQQMLALNFVQTENKLLGCLNWYPIHPVDLGQFDTRISGDNKGLASLKMEEHLTGGQGMPTFVAAFANSNCGDVSGNAQFTKKDRQQTEVQLEKHANLQFQKALKLVALRDQPLQPELEYYYREVDFSNVYLEDRQQRTYPYTIGLSAAAGSSEDSIPRYQDPITQKVKVASAVIREGLTTRSLDQFRVWWQYTLISSLMALKFNTKLPQLLDASLKRGQEPKPIIFAPMNDSTLAPHILPLQMIRLGELAIIAIPGEITTMAGRRLKQHIKSAFRQKNIWLNEVVLTSYANEYAQYITTKEEYDLQHYEGASTPFGPYTLAAFQQEYARLILET